MTPREQLTKLLKDLQTTIDAVAELAAEHDWEICYETPDNAYFDLDDVDLIVTTN